MEENIEIKGGIDSGWESYWGDKQKEVQQSMSETVSATTDDDLHSEETVALPEEVDQEAITLAEENIIEAAVLNQDLSSNELADRLDKHGTVVRQVLREKCPEWYNDVFKSNGSSTMNGRAKTVTASDVKSYIQSHNGVTMEGLTSHFDVTRGPIQDRLDEIPDGEIRAETNVPGYHGRTKVYYADEGDADPVEEMREMREENADVYEEMGEVGCCSKGEEKENGTGASKPELCAVIAGMKATAEYEETVKALEVVEEYL